MRLKKVVIFGFKSFADKTTLEFLPGITAIVGPNGCGKSNIADAFRWVMGEQSAKSMRGSKMPDVIFAGTTQRKPLNFAEVTLVFDDIQGQLPIAYEEVSISRRLHRSGESDYCINGHEVRLKDIHNLFLDSGIGRNAFAIFEQGKIDQIINYGPLERRFIFEEAAGIIRFLQRKRETLRRLEQAENNTARVRDIHQEVEKQIIILEQQSEKARLYKEKKAVLESTEQLLYIAKWDALNKKSIVIKERESHQQSEIKQIMQKQQSSQTQLEEARVLLETNEIQLKSDSEKVFKARSTKEIITKERLNNQERLKESVTKEKEYSQEIIDLKKQSKERENELINQRQKLKELEESRVDFDAKIKILQEEEKALETNVSGLRNRQQQIYQQRMKCIQTENLFESELKQNKIRIENTHERINNQYTRRDKLAQQMEEFTHHIVEKKQLMQEGSENIDKQKIVFATMEEELDQITEQLEIAQTGLEKVSHELAEHKARQKVLTRLKEEMEGFSTASKRLIQESANPKSTLYNKVKGLYEYLQPKAEANTVVSKALAASMRTYAQTLVVQTMEDFHACTAFASAHNLKDFSLFCMDQLDQKSVVSQNKNTDSLHLQMNDHALVPHFLGHVSLVETVKNALEKKDSQECWSTDGAFIDRHRVIFYMGDNDNNLFMRTSELTRLEKKIKDREQHRQILENAVKTLQQKKSMLQIQRVELDKAIRKEEMRLVEINFSLQRLGGDLEKGRIESLQIEQEISFSQENVKKLATAIEDLENKKIAAHTQTIEIQEQLKTLEEALKNDVEKLKREQHTLQLQQEKHQKVLDEHNKIVHAINLCEVKQQESEQRIVRLEQEILRGQDFQSKVAQQSEECEETLIQVERNLDLVTKDCKQLEETIAQQKQTIKRLEVDIKQENEQAKKREIEINQLHLQAAHQESTRSTIEKELYERYQLNIDELRSRCSTTSTATTSISDIENTVKMLRQEIEAFGDINMTSIEEYDKHKVRYTFLNEQIDDMTVSKNELIKIIAELDTQSRKIFKETFEVIKANFQKNFKILFNGGEADLQFTDTQDALEAGIEIIAKPPGKQMRSIQLLSGGEKCLTALALLFAIFEVKPAPFCILDEVDAPLDDSNVERFANVMKQFIDKCQFLIITHNKRTMAIADMLFGVSMQERGVSKILSMEFSHTTAHEMVTL